MILLAPAGAQTTSMVLDGSQSGEFLGSATVFTEDLDGDGVREIVVGSKLFADGSGPVGQVCVRSGANFQVLWATTGTQPLSEFGSALCTVADVDGDMIPEIAVGSPGHNLGNGRVTLLDGATGIELWAVDGTQAERLGFSLASVGDQNGDGFDVLAVGGPFYTGSLANQGNVRLLRAQDGSQFRQFTGNLIGEIFGFSVSDAGDVAGDSRLEIIIGSPFYNPGQNAALGRVVVIIGGSGLVHFSRDGVNAGQQFGSAVERIPDLNGDGLHDLLVGAPANDGVFAGSGITYLLDGSNGAELNSWEGQQAGEAFGSAIAHLGPRNSDAFDEFVIGGPGYDDGLGPSQGRVVVMNGATQREIIELFGPSSGSRFGEALGRGALLNADDRTDFIVGAPQHLVGATGTNSGQAIVYHAPTWSRFVGSNAPANTLDLRLRNGVSLGTTTSIEASNGPPGANGLLGLSVVQESTPYSGGIAGQGEILISLDPALLYLEPLVFDTLGEVTLLRPIPVIPDLAGRTLFIQIGAFEPTGNGFRWSNGVRITLGW